MDSREMDEEELDRFRTRWVSEIQSKKNTEEKDVNEKQCNESSSQKEDQISNQINKNKDQKTDVSRYESRKVDEYEAFNIANRYLTISDTKSCKYCSNEGSSNFKSVSCKRKYRNINTNCKSCHDQCLNSPHLDPGPSKRKYENNENSSAKKKDLDQSLIEVLIADIDEITCVPFFDTELPKEIAVKIFRQLSMADLARCACVSTQWRKIAEDDVIWYDIHVNVAQKGVNSNRLAIVDRENWKDVVRGYFEEKRLTHSKWKERLCEVRHLENEKGGILCAADICGERLVVAYLDGSIRIWNVLDGSYGSNLKENHTNDEEIITSICKYIKLSECYCAAAFQNGDILIWRVDGTLSGSLVYIVNYESAEIRGIHFNTSTELDNQSMAVFDDNKITVISHIKGITSNDGGSEDSNTNAHRWSVIYEKNVSEKISNLFFHGADYVIISFKHELRKINIRDRSESVLDNVVGAVISCIDHTNLFVVAAVSSFGYSVLGGFRIRKYCLSTGSQTVNLIGAQCKIDYIRFQDDSQSCVVVGCSDGVMRIYDLDQCSLMTSLPMYDFKVTSIQMDDWKIVSGYEDGSVKLWDRSAAVMCWESKIKHPAHLLHFTNQYLTSVNIPLDKFPKNSNWYADDLVQHRRFRGTIRVMDFTKDLTAIIPEEFHADYDNITGYDYNIQLIAPYDNINDSMNLPKI